MGRPKRDVRAAAEASTTPPAQLTESQSLAQVVKAEGNNHYSCMLPDKRTVLVELDARFRNTIWIKRGGYVLVDLASSEEQKSKVEGEIVNVVREEREWRKQAYWPKEFSKSSHGDEDSDEDESTVGKMPPSYSDEDE
ncbi:hypothetical protein F4780DRAFT_194457 [Xylariomycetidae sp. FL0641]|nr:hypothetical protein F4780DRAFT_194457 [Xylariomycetidae sp. FL0641]